MLQLLQYAPPAVALITVDVAIATVCPMDSSPYRIYYNTYRMPELQQSLQYIQYPENVLPVVVLLTVDIPVSGIALCLPI